MKCIKCHLEWNVSEKRDLNKPYICPHCEQKILNVKTKGKKMVNINMKHILQKVEMNVTISM